jgi:hypothetical protein
MREMELGLVTDRFFEAYSSVSRVLEEPGGEMERVEIGGGRYVDFQLFPNWNRPQRTWRYPDHRDVRLVMRVTTDGEVIGLDSLMPRLRPIGEWRVLRDH